MMINTLTGALAIKVLHERPDSFLDHRCIGAPTLLLLPHRREDFEAVMISESGAVLAAPMAGALAASHYFSLCGLPVGAVSLASCYERYELPMLDFPYGDDSIYPVICKQICSKTVVFSGGMEHVLYTDGGKCRTRMIEAPSEIDFSRELLCRMRVMGELPDAARSIAYRRAAGVWRMASTDDTLTLDSVLPLVGLLVHLGERGDIRIVCRGVEFPITVSVRGDGAAYVCARRLFPSG